MGDLSENFSRHEFACKCGCGFDTVDADLLDLLQRIRSHFGEPITITSACRCPERNKKVGGAANSQHLYGRAADIVVSQLTLSRAADFAHCWLGDSGGVGEYADFVHIDTRTNGPARWEG